MSVSNMFWFHCGRCGSLFQAQAGDVESRLCPHCGADPVPGVAGLQPAATAVGEATDHHESTGHGRHHARKRRTRYFMFKLAVVWSLVLVLIIMGARKIWPPQAPEPEVHAAASPGDAPAPNVEDAVLYQKAAPACAEAFSRFLSAGTPEARSQFVFSPLTTAARMARFQSLNPVPDVDPATLRLTDSGLLDLPGGKAFEARWTSTDGKMLETVFRQENGEWRLDWENYARYSDHPWALFLAGTGPDQGEFRLLARERLAQERKNEDTISLVLYAPRFGHPHETGFQSPEFLVSRKSRDGKLLDAAFKLARSGGRLFGSRLPGMDPEEMIRVRVQVRRFEQDDTRKYEITAVKACHWLTLDDPGVQPEETQESH